MNDGASIPSPHYSDSTGGLKLWSLSSAQSEPKRVKVEPSPSSQGFSPPHISQPETVTASGSAFSFHPSSVPPNTNNIAVVDDSQSITQESVTRAISSLQTLQSTLAANSSLLAENAALKHELERIKAELLRPVTLTQDQNGGSTGPSSREQFLLAEIGLLKSAKDTAEYEVRLERTRHLATVEQLRQARARSDGSAPAINQTVIVDLALKLIDGGPGIAATVSGLLLDEVAKSGAWEKDHYNWQQDTGLGLGGDSGGLSNHQHHLGPTQRLTSLEGVVDVTLGRVYSLEKSVRDLKGFN
jgi:hypothetical protein